jgi:hypothetical protein
MTCVYGESSYFRLLLSGFHLLDVEPNACRTAVPRLTACKIRSATIADLHAVNMAQKDDTL